MKPAPKYLITVGDAAGVRESIACEGRAALAYEILRKRPGRTVLLVCDPDAIDGTPGVDGLSEDDRELVSYLTAARVWP